MLTQFKFFFVLIAMALFTACGGGKSAETVAGKDLFSHMRGAESGELRGLSIGSSIKEVLKAEDSDPHVREDDTYLVYTFPLEDNSLYSVTYSLDELGLYEIQIEADLTDKELTANLFGQFKELFENRYGIPFKAEPNQASWILKHDQYQEIEVLITDESENYDR